MTDPELHLGGEPGDGAGGGRDPLVGHYTQLAERVAALTVPPSLHRLEARGRGRRRRRLVVGSVAASAAAVLGVLTITSSLSGQPTTRTTPAATSSTSPAPAPTGSSGRPTGGPGPVTGSGGQSTGQGTVTVTISGGPTTSGPSGTALGPPGTGAPGPSGTVPVATGSSAPSGSPTASSPRTTTPTTTTSRPRTYIVSVPMTSGSIPLLGCRPIVTVTRQLTSNDAVSAMRAMLAGPTAAEAAQGITSPFGPATAARTTVSRSGSSLTVNFFETSTISTGLTCHGAEAQTMLQRVASNYGLSADLQVNGSALLWNLWVLGL